MLTEEILNEFDFLKPHEKRKILERFNKEKDTLIKPAREYVFELSSDKIYSGKRPRAGRNGVYAPDKSDKVIIRKLIQEQINLQYPNADFTNYNHIEVDILANFKITKMSKYDTVMSLLNIYKNKKKPDVDNISKIYLDSANGLLWNDDCEITKLVVEKKFAKENKLIMKVIYK